MFVSRKGQGHLHPSQAWRIMRAAAERAGVDLPVCPIGYAMPMPPTPWIGGRRSTWFKPPWAMLRLPQRESTSMPDLRIVRHGIWECRKYEAEMPFPDFPMGVLEVKNG